MVAVNRDAVLDLLRQPLINAFRLPGLSQKEFPFLDAWNADPQAMESARSELY
ncbi:hypothetical protein EV687_0569 [Corticibacter populi]|nr:hypothetical protein EV687_0569 [Corticibacter populi]